MTGIWVERTPAAKRFRQHAGYANFRLNTIVVGLEAVKSGVATKPADLAVHWQPKDVAAAAELARGFATNAVMVYVVDALDSYMSDLSHSDLWISNPDVASILRGDFQTDRFEVQPLSQKAVTQLVNQIIPLPGQTDLLEETFRYFVAKHFGYRHRPSLRARFEILEKTAGDVPIHYVCAVHFLISWRNRHVHGRSTDRVSSQILTELHQAAQIFFDTHAHLDVGRMIENYNSGKSPTLKEVSSLISVVHRVIKIADERILRSADAYRAFISSLKSGFAAEKSPEARLKEYWGMDVTRRQSKIVAMARRFGFQDGEDAAISGKPLYVHSEQIRDITEMKRQDFGSLVGIVSASSS